MLVFYYLEIGYCVYCYAFWVVSKYANMKFEDISVFKLAKLTVVRSVGFGLLSIVFVPVT